MKAFSITKGGEPGTWIGRLRTCRGTENPSDVEASDCCCWPGDVPRTITLQEREGRVTTRVLEEMSI